MAKRLPEDPYMLRYTYTLLLAVSELSKTVHEIIKIYLNFRACDLLSTHLVTRATMQDVPTQLCITVYCVNL